MSEGEIKFLREHLIEICNFKELQQKLTFDVLLDILKRVCFALSYLQQENHYLKSVNSFSKMELYKINKDRLDANSRLVKENKYLKERVEYLERSNNRKEETITSIRDELVITESVLDEIREYINGAYEMGCYTKSISLDQENIEDLVEILDKVKEWN